LTTSTKFSPARAEFDLARLEATFATCTSTMRRVPLSITAESGTVSTGALRRPRTRLRVHRGLEQLARIGELDADGRRSRFGLQRRIDVGHRGLEHLVRIGRGPDARLGAGLDKADVLLGQIGDDPDRTTDRSPGTAVSPA
jgi:hypothetical protein